MRGHTQIVTSVQFSPDGARLLTGSPDGTARVWRVDNGAQTRSVDHLQPEARTIAETRAAWTSDGDYFVTDGVGSSSVSMWHADSGLRLVQALGERATAQPGGHALVTSYSTLGEVYRCETCAGVAGAAAARRGAHDAQAHEGGARPLPPRVAVRRRRAREERAHTAFATTVRGGAGIVGSHSSAAMRECERSNRPIFTFSNH